MSGPTVLNYQPGICPHDKNYQFTIYVNWLNDIDTVMRKKTKEAKQEHAKKVSKNLLFPILMGKCCLHQN
jgi:hypothetical protein